MEMEVGVEMGMRREVRSLSRGPLSESGVLLSVYAIAGTPALRNVRTRIDRGFRGYYSRTSCVMNPLVVVTLIHISEHFQNHCP